MGRRGKQLISGLILIFCFFSIVTLPSVLNEAKGTDWMFVFIIWIFMLIIFIISIYAVVYYSKTGPQVRGTEGEWAAAMMINPGGTVFFNGDYKQHTAENKDKKLEEEYYRNRDANKPQTKL